MSHPEDAIGNLAKVIAVLMTRHHVTELEITDAECAAVPHDAMIELVRPFQFTPLDDRVVIKLHGAAAAPERTRPKPDPADRLPRMRNPRIGCELVDGTWVHGRPHDCPRSARGFHG